MPAAPPQPGVSVFPAPGSAALRAWALRLLGWLAFAALITWPAAIQPGALLIGDQDVDCWNHAWGYWFVAESLARGELPYHTALVGAPEGGVLWFIDPLGAFLSLPITLTLGPAVAYNAVLIGRVAAAGFAAQLLSDEVSGPGPHGWLAGVGVASSPFLLAELGNGISEVCAISGVALALWASARAQRLGTLRAWLVAGALLGLSTWASFYYGLATGVAVATLVIVRWSDPPAPSRARVLRVAAAAGLSVVVALPPYLTFRASLHHDDALVQRHADLNMKLLQHNAVDPRVFVTPGEFWSVNLDKRYGEKFRHTGYLRWTLLSLALVGLVRRREIRPWGWVAGVSLALGMGPFVWWTGEWVVLGGRYVPLPFYLLRLTLPNIAITHPLRLAVAAQIVVPLLAAAGLQALARGRAPRLASALSAGLCALAFLETAVFSLARWPLPTSSTRVPDVYAGLPDAPVLDTPVQVGNTMAANRYFWYQTAHGRPVPWVPEMRETGERDRNVIGSLGGLSEGPIFGSGRVDGEVARRRYGAVVLHKDLAERVGAYDAYMNALETALGPGEVRGEAVVWVLRP